MTKTKITKEIEQALIQHYCSGQFKNYYGALEVPVGKWLGKGKENIDMACYKPSNQEIICCEIKVTKSDFNSAASLSFYGNKNYLAMPLNLAQEIDYDWKHVPEECAKWTHIEQMRQSGCGIIGYDQQQKTITIVRNSKRREVHLNVKMQLIEGILRAGCRDAYKWYAKKDI